MAKGLAPRRKALIFLGTSLPLPQLRHEHDLPRLRAFGPDEAVVSLGNAPGDGEPYTLTSGGTELATATAGGTGTAAVTTPDTSADTADTHQTSDSHAGLYITLGTVAVLGAAAAMVVVVLRKQKKA